MDMSIDIIRMDRIQLLIRGGGGGPGFRFRGFRLYMRDVRLNGGQSTLFVLSKTKNKSPF